MLKRSDNKILDNLSRPLKNSPADHNQWSWLKHLSLKIILEKVLTQKKHKITHLLFQLWTCSVCIHCKTKTNKKICGFKKNRGFLKIFKNRNLLEANFLKIRSSINLPWGHARFHKKYGPVPFSRFFLYKQTDRQANYIYRYYKTNKIITWKKGANYHWSLVNWLKNRKKCDLQICKQRNVRSEKEVKGLSFSIHFEISENCNR